MICNRVWYERIISDSVADIASIERALTALPARKPDAEPTDRERGLRHQLRYKNAVRGYALHRLQIYAELGMLER